MPNEEKKKQPEAEEPEDLTSQDAPNDDTADKATSDVPPLADDQAEPDTEEPADDEAQPEEGGDDKAAQDSSLDSISEPQETPVTEAGDETTPFDDDKTDQAIDEIVAKEGDDALAAQDAAVAVATATSKPTKRSFFKRKWVWWVLFLLIFGGITAAMAVPTSRYWVLNTAGVRSGSSLTIVDSTTQLPLKGVSISLAGQQKETDSDGKVTFSGLKLGAAQLKIEQVGFEEITRSLIIGWGSNPLGTVALRATGVQYIIEVRDYLSDQPLEGVEATDGSTTAVSDKKGKITLTLEDAVVAKDAVTLSKAGYRNQPITLSEDPEKPTKVTMVLARKAVFVTKQSGKYDVYKSDIDGKNREVLLPGTGHENSNISLVVSSDGKRAALVSTRDNKRDGSGFLLSSIALINVENGQTTTIAEGSQIQLIDWIGSRLIYQIVSSSASANNRYTVVSYNYTDNTRLQLAAANTLTAVMSAQGLVYYAVPAGDSGPTSQTGFFKIKPDGTEKQRVFEDGLDTVLRSTYGTFSLQTDEGTWYTYDIAGASKTQIAAPSSLANRLYTDNTDHSRSLWVSQGTLMSYEIATNKDTSVKVQGGLAYPVQWLSSTAALYRVSSGNEIADYAISVLGGTAHKVADVAVSYGFAQSQ